MANQVFQLNRCLLAGSISDYEGVNKVPKKTMPLIAVNTTAGTASEMTRFAIITDHARKVKMAIIDWYAAIQCDCLPYHEGPTIVVIA